MNRSDVDGQREHWQITFQANPNMYGTDPSEAGAYATELFKQQHIREVVELGSGQGRDSLAFLRAGLQVSALDCSSKALASLHQAATVAGFDERLVTLVHDVRAPLPLPNASSDAVYSHILFSMALQERLNSLVLRARGAGWPHARPKCQAGCTPDGRAQHGWPGTGR